MDDKINCDYEELPVKEENFELYTKKFRKEDFIKSLQEDYDTTVNSVIDRTLVTISNKYFEDGILQILSFFFISMVWVIVNGWYAYSVVFIGYSPSHKCAISPNDTFLVHVDDCTVFNTNTNKTYECTEWTYDKSQMRSTIITEYNFVCSKNYYLEVAYCIEQSGYMVGIFIFSRLADKIGRKSIFSFVLFFMSMIGISQYFVKNFYIYTALGFITNCFATGIDAVSIPLVVEMFQTKKRTFYGMGMEYIWVIMATSLSPLAYMIKSWRELKLTIFIVIAVTAFMSLFLVQESLTWLISSNKLRKAKVVIERIARFNRITNTKLYRKRKAELYQIFDILQRYNNDRSALLNEENIKISESKEEFENAPTGGTCSQIFSHKKFCFYIVIITLNAFILGLVYDGLTLLNATFGENIFINWIIMNSIELPAQILGYYLISRIGRRLISSIFLILGGVALILNSINYLQIFTFYWWLKLLLFILAKFSIGISISVFILHSSEIFPTNIRSCGYAIGTLSFRMITTISPMVSLYLTKILPWLPLTIYAFLSILAGWSYLYLPETLNRALPNSIDDVIKWPRALTKEERASVKQIYKKPKA